MDTWISGFADFLGMCRLGSRRVMGVRGFLVGGVSLSFGAGVGVWVFYGRRNLGFRF